MASRVESMPRGCQRVSSRGKVWPLGWVLVTVAICRAAAEEGKHGRNAMMRKGYWNSSFRSGQEVLDGDR